jgi:hypothetical protein
MNANTYKIEKNIDFLQISNNNEKNSNFLTSFEKSHLKLSV